MVKVCPQTSHFLTQENSQAIYPIPARNRFKIAPVDVNELALDKFYAVDKSENKNSLPFHTRELNYDDRR
jgi:hypothetical protein